MADRFDLEQQIMQVWGTDDDLKLIYEMTDSEDMNKIQNALLGLIELHQARSERLWNIFEELVSKGFPNERPTN
jgi:hypothetical protein